MKDRVVVEVSRRAASGPVLHSVQLVQVGRCVLCGFGSVGAVRGAVESHDDIIEFIGTKVGFCGFNGGDGGGGKD